VNRVAADEIGGVIQLCDRPFESRSPITDIVQKARHAAGVVFDDQFIGIAAGQFRAAGFDGVDFLRDETARAEKEDE